MIIVKVFQKTLKDLSTIESLFFVLRKTRFGKSETVFEILAIWLRAGLGPKTPPGLKDPRICGKALNWLGKPPKISKMPRKLVIDLLKLIKIYNDT